MQKKEKTKLNKFFNKKNIRLDYFLNSKIYNRKGYYYIEKPIGKNNDFITAPEISQMFGEIIGLYLYFNWKTKLNCKFNLIELGPGKGTLFSDIARSVIKFPEFLKKAKIIFIEINKNLKKEQKKIIKNINLKNVSWSEKINLKSSIPSIIYSNEFFDCFPVRHFVFKDKWYEKYVEFDEKDKRYFFIDKEVKKNSLKNLLKNYEKKGLCEISFQRNKYFEKICKYISKNGGLFFTIDYGYTEKINNFTLQAIQSHKYSHVLDNIGAKDISSHVNFRELINIAKINNLYVEEFCTQREFLIKYGITKRKKILSKTNDAAKINLEVDKLINKNDMGNIFKCLVVSKFK